MALIPRFGLYFGHPIPATAAVVGALLFASGLGSFASERIAALRSVRAAVPAAIALLAALGGVALTPLLIKTIAWPTAAKVLVSLAVLTPPAFLMGVPFPAGIRALAERNEAAIPWAWGINGCFSVLGASLATIIAVEAGFTALMGAAASLSDAPGGGVRNARRACLGCARAWRARKRRLTRPANPDNLLINKFSY